MTEDIENPPPPSASATPATASKAVASHYFSRQSPHVEEEVTTAENTATARAIAPGKTRHIEAQVRRADSKVSLRLATGAGVFARSGLDAGSALLIETARWSGDARLLDLGCGWGAVGCFAAAFSPGCRVSMCDINHRAVALARLNLRENNLSNAAAWCGDGGTALRSECFDAVLCNPPVRAGNAVVGRLFEDARRVLKPAGTLWVVLRTAQGAKSWQRRLQDMFGDCETVAMRQGYRILKSVR